MLEDITIKDYALIESTYLEFHNGFTVLSGETGAGKSIIIGAMSFLLGGKADVSVIRTGKTEASVTATFYLGFNTNPKNGRVKALSKACLDRTYLGENNYTNSTSDDEEASNAYEWLDRHGIEVEDNRIILRRFIRDSGKSGAWINNTPVTRADLVSFSSFLIDIHGQHDHQSLMKVSEHRKFLDSRAGIIDIVDEFKKLYTLLVQKREELHNYSMSESDRLRKIDMCSFAVKEISDAKLKPEEDVLLEEEQSRLSSFEKLYSTIDEINQIFSDSDGCVIESLKKVRRNISFANDLDKSLNQINERIESSFYELNDISEELSSYLQKLVFDPNRLDEVNNRLSLIYNLKKKYASSVNAPLSEVFTYLDKAQKFLDENLDGNDKKQMLSAEIKKLEKEVLQKAAYLSEKRISCAKELEKEVDEILVNLGMKGTTFGVSIKEKSGTEVEQKCGPYGKDDVEFLISANPGNPLLPLAKIASGGELSRVMLALKTIFAKTDSVGTLIFDEIDTGIGGEIAVSVGNHIKKLATGRQIFCITHLASIAVYADNQVKIEKSVTGGVTASNVHAVEGEDRVLEIARMLSGDSDSSESIEHARKLLNKYSGGF